MTTELENAIHDLHELKGYLEESEEDQHLNEERVEKLTGQIAAAVRRHNDGLHTTAVYPDE